MDAVRISMKEIMGAVARGWTYPKNTRKVMDTDLAEAISKEVFDLFIADKRPYLGCATTRELIEELDARSEISQLAGESWPNYRTVDSTGH